MTNDAYARSYGRARWEQENDMVDRSKLPSGTQPGDDEAAYTTGGHPGDGEWYEDADADEWYEDKEFSAEDEAHFADFIAQVGARNTTNADDARAVSEMLARFASEGDD